MATRRYYSATAIDSTVFTAINSTSATVVLSAGFTPITGFSYSTTYCANSANELPTTVNGFYTGGLFSSTNGLSINATTGEINFASSTPGNYTITYTVQSNLTNCNIGGTSSFAISISNALDYVVQSVCQGQLLELHVTPTGSSFNVNDPNYSWTNSSNAPVGTNSSIFNVEDYINQNPSISFPLRFNVTVQLNGCSYTSNFTVNNNPCKLIPKGISPNNDQMNDTFDLSGIGVTELEIFNRYGTKVYSFSGNYTNQWGGLTNEGKDLPDGTYFYSIKKNDGTSATGWVYINK
jgi:gliding motility-associated-like protein